MLSAAAAEHGVGSSRTVVVYATREFLARAGSGDDVDACARELRVALGQRGADRLVVAIADEDMRDRAAWPSKVREMLVACPDVDVTSSDDPAVDVAKRVVPLLLAKTSQVAFVA